MSAPFGATGYQYFNCEYSPLVPARFLLVADLLPVLPGVGAQRVRERRWTVDAAIGDVVGELSLFRIEIGEMADPLADFVIGARGIAADPESAGARLPPVERHTAAERDRAAADLAVGLAGVLRRDEAFGVERVRLRHAPQRMAWLRERVEPGGRERQRVGAECVRRVRLRLGDRLAARPRAGRLVGRDSRRADLPLAVDDRRPFHFSRDQAAAVPPLGRRLPQPLLQIVGAR